MAERAASLLVAGEAAKGLGIGALPENDVNAITVGAARFGAVREPTTRRHNLGTGVGLLNLELAVVGGGVSRSWDLIGLWPKQNLPAGFFVFLVDGSRSRAQNCPMMPVSLGQPILPASGLTAFLQRTECAW